MPRHTHFDRRGILDQWRRSGLAAPDFAIACGVSVATLYKWRRDAAPAFVEVVEPLGAPPPAQPASASASIELILPGGAAVRVGP